MPKQNHRPQKVQDVIERSERLTDGLVSKLPVDPRAPYEKTDAELRNFAVRVQPNGTRTYLARYRHRVLDKATGRFVRRSTRMTIGNAKHHSAAAARKAARKVLATASLFDREGKIIPKENLRKLMLEAVTGISNIEDATEASQSIVLRDLIDNHYKKSLLHKSTKDRAHDTCKRMKFVYKRFLGTPINQLTRAEIEEFMNLRVQEGKAATTINRDLACLKAAFKVAVHRQLISEDRIADIPLKKIDRSPKPRYLTDAEKTRLLKNLQKRDEKLRQREISANKLRRSQGKPEKPLRHAGNAYVDHLEPMVLVSLHTGIRRGELFSLRWADVDLKQKNLTVNGSSAKSNQTRTIPLNKIALTTLRQWRKQKAKNHRLKKTDYVFPNDEGKRLTDIKTSWSVVRKRAKLRNFRWHDLRHTFASNLVQRKATLQEVQQLLGHSTIAMTQRYAHIDSGQLVDTVSLLDD